MSNIDNHAIHPGGTPLNSNPDPDDDAHNVHGLTADQDETYVDPVTHVNHAGPISQAQLDADEAAND